MYPGSRLQLCGGRSRWEGCLWACVACGAFLPNIYIYSACAKLPCTHGRTYPYTCHTVMIIRMHYNLLCPWFHMITFVWQEQPMIRPKKKEGVDFIYMYMVPYDKQRTNPNWQRSRIAGVIVYLSVAWSAPCVTKVLLYQDKRKCRKFRPWYVGKHSETIILQPISIDRFTDPGHVT